MAVTYRCHIHIDIYCSIIICCCFPLAAYGE